MSHNVINMVRKGTAYVADFKSAAPVVLPALAVPAVAVAAASMDDITNLTTDVNFLISVLNAVTGFLTGNIIGQIILGVFLVKFGLSELRKFISSNRKGQ